MSISVSTPWSSTEDALLREKFATCKTIREVMAFLPGRTYDSIRSRAQKLEIAIKVLPVHNRHYFDTPTEQNCAVAGFIAGNGSVTSGEPRLVFNMSSKDRAHLEAVRAALDSTANILDSENHAFDEFVKPDADGNKKTYSLSRMQITGGEICAKLGEHWNIFPRKTETLRPPNISDPRLVAAFISGLIDGNGWIVEYVSETDTTKYNISLGGKETMLTWVKAHFDQWAPESDAAIVRFKEADSTFNYSVGGAKVYWLAKIFLSLDIIRLERKWSKLRRYVEMVESANVSPIALSALRETHPLPEIAATFGLTSAIAHIESMTALRTREYGSYPKYDYDRSFFSTITPRTSYWAGLICTDGCLFINRNSKAVRWSVAEKDRCLLEWFKAETKLEQPIVNFMAECNLPGAKAGPTPQCRISIESATEWHADLERNFNITVNKTLRCELPTFPDIISKLSFLRGFIDGDGCVTRSNQPGSMTIMVCGVNREIIAGIKRAIDDLNLPRIDRGRESLVRQGDDETCYYFTVRGLQAAVLFTLLRRLPTPNLSRKWDNPAILAIVDFWKARTDIWPPESFFTSILNGSSPTTYTEPISSSPQTTSP